MSIPLKHHFVHSAYQKRFLAHDKKLYVLTNEFDKNITLKTPSQICYELNLHTLTIKNQKFYEIECFYSSVENEISKILKVIDTEEQKYNNIWEEALKKDDIQFILKFFISIMFWRNPKQTTLAKVYSEKLIDLYDNAHIESKKILNERKTIKYTQKNRDKHDLLKVIQFILLPLLTFKIWDKEIKINIARANKSDIVLTCDNPVVYQNDLECLFKYENFYIPLDKNSILTSKSKIDNKMNVVELNLETAKNSHKYIMGASLEMMEYIKELL
ncbi:DUF4238 domain-containing protein [Acinetobacter baumannii]|uniref:DUF4238 domain-containing protein n=1 Tax=Acinetobacter baumannii TaxID=470 RepID=UPI00259DD464|nr:DUF4238 domain-containing protein [Acinetobacter baumannii]